MLRRDRRRSLLQACPSFMLLSQSLSLSLAALVVEALFGYPARLYRLIGHPVTWMGDWLRWLERKLNRPESSFERRRLSGVLGLVIYLAPVALITGVFEAVCRGVGWPGVVVLVLIAASLPAQRSLYSHVQAVADGLDRSLEDGRGAVSAIVGRNPHVLDGGGVARAAIESLGGELFRRSGRPLALDSAWRPNGWNGLQGGQYG